MTRLNWGGIAALFFTLTFWVWVMWTVTHWTKEKPVTDRIGKYESGEVASIDTFVLTAMPDSARRVMLEKLTHGVR